VSVGRSHHRDLDSLIAHSSDAASPISFDRHAPFQHKAEFDEEGNRGIKVLHHDAHVIHACPGPDFSGQEFGVNPCQEKGAGNAEEEGCREGCGGVSGRSGYRDWRRAGAAAEVKRWSAGRQQEVVLRRLRGDPVDAISREGSVPIDQLAGWRDRALAGIDAGRKERENDPVERPLDEAKRRIGERVMEVEILQKERRAKPPWVGRRSSR